ncbi:MAG TPA: AMP-binding protein [Acidimicrobiia bacterium]|nr:AMP-binding protein [Acidimicrobiia bacterium]
MTAATLPALLVANATEHPGGVAMREKRRGIWASRTWADYATDVRILAAGLTELGFRRDDKLAVIGDNRPALYDTMLATQALGGLPLPLYQDSNAEELGFVVAHSDARVVVAEDQEQVDKLLALGDGIAAVEHIICVDPRGMRAYTDPRLVLHSEIVERGREADRADPGRFDAEVAAGKPSDIALISYTSGTTGQPKGVMLSHAGFLTIVEKFLVAESRWQEGREQFFSYLPMAWVGDTIFSLAFSLRGRFTVNIPEEPETVIRDLREVGPTIFLAPPRIWENVLRDVEVRMQDATWIKRRIYRGFIERAARNEADRMQGERPHRSAGARVVDRAGEVLLYGSLRDQLGLGQVRTAYAGGAALGDEAIQRLRGIGVNVKQLYGSTEMGLVTLTPDDDVVPDTVGRPLPGVDITVSDDGEVLVRSDSLFDGYYKNPEATTAAMTPDGFFRSGDCGYFDAEGRLFVLDRAKDVAKLADGTTFAPQIIENKLKFSPYIREAVTVGDGRPFVAALINIDIGSVGKWADKHSVSYAGFTDLSGKAAVYDLVATEIDRVNAGLPDALRIRRFLCLHKELDPDDAELTRTRKLRRRLIGERYAVLIDALYGETAAVQARITVTYEDGRVAESEALVPVRTLDSYDANGAGTVAAPVEGTASR